MKKLYIGNLPYRAQDSELEEWFGAAGFAVDSVAIVRDRSTGDSRGFGFVEFNDDNVAVRAIESCNGQDFQGRNLVIDEARPEGERGGGGGRGGRRGGHSRGY